jgi:hypothetical protein
VKLLYAPSRDPVFVVPKAAAKTLGYVEEFMDQRFLLLIVR